MALGAVVAAALTDHSAKPKALYLQGLELLREPGTPGDRYGVPIESVTVTEAAPGQVSAMSFVISDPRGAVSVMPGQEVLFMDTARDVPIFRGWVDSYGVRPAGIGRSISVECVGIEKVLDWAKLPAITVSAAAMGGAIDAYGAMASILAQALSFGFLPRMAQADSTLQQSSLASPTYIPSTWSAADFDEDIVIASGETLRAALTKVIEKSNIALLGFDVLPGVPVITVDFYGGLRIWDASGLYGSNPIDYADTITFDTGGALKPSGLDHATSTADAVRGVLVTGGNVIGTGLVTDGTGRPGTIDTLTDAESLTAAHLAAVGAYYLAQHGETARGTVIADDALNVGAQGTERRAGGTDVVITDAQVGLSAYRSTIAQIDKVFRADGTEEWTIAYGSVASGAQLLRRLTS